MKFRTIPQITKLGYKVGGIYTSSYIDGEQIKILKRPFSNDEWVNMYCEYCLVVNGNFKGNKKYYHKDYIKKFIKMDNKL